MRVSEKICIFSVSQNPPPFAMVLLFDPIWGKTKRCFNSHPSFRICQNFGFLISRILIGIYIIYLVSSTGSRVFGVWRPILYQQHPTETAELSRSFISPDLSISIYFHSQTFLGSKLMSCYADFHDYYTRVRRDKKTSFSATFLGGLW